MEQEFQKIDSYFSEGTKQWQTNPELVVSYRFFELWEDIHRPRPFPITSTSLALYDQEFTLVDDDNLIGCFIWDQDEECCILMIEGEKTIQKIHIVFEDGVLNIYDLPVEFIDSMELSFGLKLEVIYDLIAHLKRSNRIHTLSSLTKAVYIELLDEIADKYDANVFKVMKHLTMDSVKKLVKKASQDMAVDELNNQLELPLDGTYANSKANDRIEFKNMDNGESKKTVYYAPRRTLWTIYRELDLLKKVTHLLMKFEDNFVIQFSRENVLPIDDINKPLFRIPVSRDISLREGDVLPVFKAGEEGSLGSIKIQLYDKDYVIASMGYIEFTELMKETGEFYALPRRSPTKFLYTSMDALLSKLLASKSFTSPLLNYIFGITKMGLEESLNDSPLPLLELDQSQEIAKIKATNSNNHIVLIQGPPGTGKTYVLETVIRDLCSNGKRILMTAPSNAAVDNVCRKLPNMPLIRLGKSKESIALDVIESCWIENREVVREFKEKRKNLGCVYCGTHVGILRDELVLKELEYNGLFDVIIFDEVGMTSMVEFILCAQLANRAVLFGDHQQLPPFPLPEKIMQTILTDGPILRQEHSLITKSALEWLINFRNLTPQLLQSSYRCQNPRLMRFSSTLFYNARVTTNRNAEYYTLSFADRQKIFPATSLKFYRTSKLPLEVRRENLELTGNRPGLENRLECKIAVNIFYSLLNKFDLNEITIIAPYRRQVRLIRSKLSCRKALKQCPRDITISKKQWDQFLAARISTVDSFQGGESDAVIICYVRSNENKGIGFVDDPNRINVAHTRSRREMVVIGDLDCLKAQSKNEIFERMERCVERDGKIIDVTEEMLEDNQYFEVEEPQIDLVGV